MTGYNYYKAWWTESYEGDAGKADHSYWHNFRNVARAAIDAAYDGDLQAAAELKSQAHSLLSQTARNMGGSERDLELKMNRILADFGIVSNN